LTKCNGEKSERGRRNEEKKLFLDLSKCPVLFIRREKICTSGADKAAGQLAGLTNSSLVVVTCST
jgi:hypothetical protein